MTVKSCVPTFVVTLIWSPTSTSKCLAELTVDDDLAAPDRGAPVGEVPRRGRRAVEHAAERRRAAAAHLLAVGRAHLGEALHVAVGRGDTRASPARSAISESGIWSRVVLNPASTLFVERTNASVLANALAKILSNVPRIVSLKTNTPDRNVVPAMIASAVSARRPLRARTFFSERRNMSLPEPLHPVEHPLGRRLGHLVDDACRRRGR